MKFRVSQLAFVAALLSFVPAVRADDSADEFKRYVQKAKVDYDLGEFDQAAEEYMAAYRIKAVPGALFNIAQAWRQAGKYEKARQFYRSYLREANPDPKPRAVVEKAIKELDELIAKETKTKNAAPNGVPPLSAGKGETASDDMAPPSKGKSASRAGSDTAPDAETLPQVPQKAAPLAAQTANTTGPAAGGASASNTTDPKSGGASSSAPPAATHPGKGTVDTQAKSGNSHTVAYVVAGAGVAVLAGGAIFAVKAGSTDSSLTSTAHDRATADSLISTSKTDHLLGALLLGVGAAAVVGGVVLFFLPTSGPSGGTGAAVGGHF